MPDGQSHPRLSVIVCTHERPDHLTRCLDALTRLEDPVEVIVVDSASNPPIDSLVERYRTRIEPLHYVYAPEPGLSIARNLGVSVATCDVVAFVDDDAAPRPDWARRIATAFEREPDIACVGGTCAAAFASDPPGWLSGRLLALAGVSSFGSEPRRVSATADFPFGANIAFWRETLIDVGGFDPKLGRIGSLLLSGEESAVVRTMLDAGYTVMLEPGAVVDHTVSTDRLEGRYYWRRFYWQGITRARMGGRVRRFGGLTLEVPGYLAAWGRTRDRYYLYRASAETLGHLAEWTGRAR
jgi:glycosyltransferase involved in cell wall biosynthesis